MNDRRNHLNSLNAPHKTGLMRDPKHKQKHPTLTSVSLLTLFPRTLIDMGLERKRNNKTRLRPYLEHKTRREEPAAWERGAHCHP